MDDKQNIRLTEFTKGGGCGCKLPPEALDGILSDFRTSNELGLIVGNSTSDDACVWDAGNGNYLIGTVDFFTPIVDDPYDFGRIAAANALSDVYAMGGRPVFALSVLGWPIDRLPAEMIRSVMAGAKDACEEAGIALAGGHSIENPEPIFGLSVTGTVSQRHLKKNSGALTGDVLLITKPIGSGLLSSGMKRGLLISDQIEQCTKDLKELNRIGAVMGTIPEVRAMTDVTGFGLVGHLVEMAEGSGLSAEINGSSVPLMEGAKELAAQMVYPDNTMRNWKQYGEKTDGAGGDLLTLCDPQTNGGLLIAVDLEGLDTVTAMLEANEQFYRQIGHFIPKEEKRLLVR